MLYSDISVGLCGSLLRRQKHKLAAAVNVFYIWGLGKKGKGDTRNRFPSLCVACSASCHATIPAACVCASNF